MNAWKIERRCRDSADSCSVKSIFGKQHATFGGMPVINRDFPSTRQFLLDHLRRIVEGVSVFYDEDGGNEQWFFGYGKDLLISEGDVPGREEMPTDAQAKMLLSAFGVAAKDFVCVERLQTALNQLSSLIGKHLELRSFLGEVLPDTAGSETLQQAYAFEMFNKLDDILHRVRQYCFRPLLLEGIPNTVDQLVKEASESFRSGFDLAAICLCRATLEEALKDRLSQEPVGEAIKRADGKHNEACLSELISRRRPHRLAS